MKLGNSKISCGIKQLYDVGRHYRSSTLEQNYERAMKNAHMSCAMVVASLTSTQTDAIKLLKRKGFKKVGKPKFNPNTANMISLYVKHL